MELDLTLNDWLSFTSEKWKVLKMCLFPKRCSWPLPMLLWVGKSDWCVSQKKSCQKLLSEDVFVLNSWNWQGLIRSTTRHVTIKFFFWIIKFIWGRKLLTHWEKRMWYKTDCSQIYRKVCGKLYSWYKPYLMWGINISKRPGNWTVTGQYYVYVCICMYMYVCVFTSSGQHIYLYAYIHTPPQFCSVCYRIHCITGSVAQFFIYIH